MPELRAVPKHFFSWGFDLFIGAAPLTTMDVNWMAEGGSFEWHGEDYRLGREGLWSGDFFLSSGEKLIATATKSSPLTRRFAVAFGIGECVFAAVHPLTRSFRLTCGGTVIGSIEPNHPFTRRCTIRLPENLSVPEQVFLFWLAVLMWRRAHNSNGGAS